MPSRSWLVGPGASIDVDFCDQCALTIAVRIKQKLRTGEFSVAGDQWPIFLYSSYKYDENDPWKGLLQSNLLVKVSWHYLRYNCTLLLLNQKSTLDIQTYLHIPQFCWKGGQGNKIRKCPHSRHDLCDSGIHCICCHAGEFQVVLAGFLSAICIDNYL